MSLGRGKWTHRGVLKRQRCYDWRPLIVQIGKQSHLSYYKFSSIRFSLKYFKLPIPSDKLLIPFFKLPIPANKDVIYTSSQYLPSSSSNQSHRLSDCVVFSVADPVNFFFGSWVRFSKLKILDLEPDPAWFFKIIFFMNRILPCTLFF